jgi:predicted GIY-YIG superfamily endonuclease
MICLSAFTNIGKAKSKDSRSVTVFIGWSISSAIGDIREAIAREKRLKRWRRDWKIQLIETDNLHWSDLLPSLMERGPRIAPLARPG